jgi:hypothetical protein
MDEIYIEKHKEMMIKKGMIEQKYKKLIHLYSILENHVEKINHQLIYIEQNDDNTITIKKHPTVNKLKVHYCQENKDDNSVCCVKNCFVIGIRLKNDLFESITLCDAHRQKCFSNYRQIIPNINGNGDQDTIQISVGNVIHDALIIKSGEALVRKIGEQLQYFDTFKII